MIIICIRFRLHYWQMWCLQCAEIKSVIKIGITNSSVCTRSAPRCAGVFLRQGNGFQRLEIALQHASLLVNALTDFCIPFICSRRKWKQIFTELKTIFLSASRKETEIPLLLNLNRFEYSI